MKSLATASFEHMGGGKEKSPRKKKKDKKKDKKRESDKAVAQTMSAPKKNTTDQSNTIEPKDNPEDAGQNTQQFKNKIEFRAAIREVEERRLREVRIWLLANTIIFIVTAPSLHFYRWNRLDYKGQAALVIQAALQVPLTMGLVATCISQLELTYPMLLLQGLQTILFNYLSFFLVDTNNYAVDNILLTSMSSIFVMFNTYLYCRLISSYFDQVLLSFGTMGCLVLSIVYSNYNWKYARGFDVMFLIFYSCMGIVLVFVFGYIQTNVNSEGQEETRLHYRQ